MSFRGLLNHTVWPYREPGPELSRDRFGGVPLQPLPVGDQPTTYNAWPDQLWGGTLVDIGAGEQQGSTRRWLLVPELDVRERDVLAVIAGPEAPKLLRVLSVTYASRIRQEVHHLEVIVEVYNGVLEAVAS